MTDIEFHGTKAEGLDLIAALGHNCECVLNEAGVRIQTCPPHLALIGDQRYLDGILAMRHLRSTLQAEEDVPFTPDSSEHLAPYRGVKLAPCSCGCGR